MRRKLIYTIIGFAILTLSLLWPLLCNKVQRLTVSVKQKTVKSIPNKNTPLNSADFDPSIAKTAHIKKKEPLRTVTTKNNTLKQVRFTELPGWNEAEVKKSLLAFQASCKTFLKQSPTHRVGSKLIDLKAKDWQPACKEAISIDSLYETRARNFFEKWFYPIEFAKNKPAQGLFTGYYMPQLRGNLTRTEKYNTPIYGLPKSNERGRPSHPTHYTRAEIDNGALKHKAPVLAWIKSPVDRQFLEIEGAGVIQLSSGKKLYLGYAGENGAPYSSISNLLIKKGVMSKDNASKASIKRYFKNQPQKANEIIHKNKSFVFFQKVKDWIALGAHGKTLTPGYSLAIDKKWIPLGAPLWLTTTIPNEKNNRNQEFQRLMIAQDTGGAIKGLVRGDIFWGSGKKATFLGENMKNKGRYWLLLPKHVFDRLARLS